MVYGYFSIGTLELNLTPIIPKNQKSVRILWIFYGIPGHHALLSLSRQEVDWCESCLSCFLNK